MKKLIALVALAACLLWPAHSQAMYVDGMNVYQYERGCPANFIDPLGYFIIPPPPPAPPVVPQGIAPAPPGYIDPIPGPDMPASGFGPGDPYIIFPILGAPIRNPSVPLPPAPLPRPQPARPPTKPPKPPTKTPTCTPFDCTPTKLGDDAAMSQAEMDAIVAAIRDGQNHHVGTKYPNLGLGEGNWKSTFNGL